MVNEGTGYNGWSLNLLRSLQIREGCPLFIKKNHESIYVLVVGGLFQVISDKAMFAEQSVIIQNLGPLGDCRLLDKIYPCLHESYGREHMQTPI